MTERLAGERLASEQWAGERLSASAARLAGMAGAALGWTPDAFWHATPAELGCVVRALAGDGGAVPPDAATIARLKEAFPDADIRG